MTTNAEDQSEIGAADPLGVVIERVLTEAYSKTAEEKMTLEAGTASCLVNELKTLRFIQATANAELRAEVEKLREALKEIENMAYFYESPKDIIRLRLKGVYETARDAFAREVQL